MSGPSAAPARTYLRVASVAFVCFRLLSSKRNPSVMSPDTCLAVSRTNRTSVPTNAYEFTGVYGVSLQCPTIPVGLLLAVLGVLLRHVVVYCIGAAERTFFSACSGPSVAEGMQRVPMQSFASCARGSGAGFRCAMVVPFSSTHEARLCTMHAPLPPLPPMPSVGRLSRVRTLARACASVGMRADTAPASFVSGVSLGPRATRAAGQALRFQDRPCAHVARERL